MKRRKWWFTALSLALLAACVGVWNWSERPPYKFMHGMRLIALWRNSPPAGGFRYWYVTSRPVGDLLSEARREVKIYEVPGRPAGSRIWHIKETERIPWASIEEAGSRAGKRLEGPVYVDVPIGSTAIIDIVQSPTSLDRVRAWVYRLGHAPQ